MSDYDKSIHSNPSAEVWAKFFMKTYEQQGKPQIDEEMMLGWFANAMMAMHDYLHQQKRAGQMSKLAEFILCIIALTIFGFLLFIFLPRGCFR